jgi:hypothetical protein
MEIQMGLRPAGSLDSGEDSAKETEERPVERLDERRADREGGA